MLIGVPKYMTTFKKGKTKGMKIFITGGAGYIGSTLVSQLIQKEGVSRIVALDNEQRGDFKNIKDFAERNQCQRKLTIVKKDLLDLDYDEHLENSDAVIHLAATVGERFCEENPQQAMDVNIKGLFLLLKHMQKLKVSKFVFASSQVVYGEPDRIPFREDFERAPRGIYALTKSFGEEIIQRLFVDNGIDSIILRFSSVYGFGLYSQWGSLTGKFARLIYEGKNLPIYSDGEQKADFIHVRDICDCISNIIFSQKHGIWRECYNLGGGESVSINDLADRFISIGKTRGDNKIRKEYVEPNRKEVRERRLDITRLRERIGWSPRISLDNGIKDLIEKWEKIQEGEAN
jgi:UDP-glucose 4-epimerase